MKYKFPGINVIISEITPRMDAVDLKVKSINTMMNAYVKHSADLFIVRNSNLRDPDFYYDNKHIKQSCVARFASNIKRTLRLAYGVQDPRTAHHTSIEDGGNQHSTSTLKQKSHDQRDFQLFKANLLQKITAAFE